MPRRKTDDEYKRDLKNKNPNLESLETYINNSTKLKTLCKICGNIWFTTPAHLLCGCGCPVCAVRKITKTDEQFRKEVRDINPNIEPLETYVNDKTKIKVKCKECSNEWYAYPTHLIRGVGCSVCTKYSMEKPVLRALKKKGIDYLYNTSLKGCNYNSSSKELTVDFIIETPKGKLAIETDGKQHFREWHRGEKALQHLQAKDRYKDKYLKEHGYILIRVTSSPTKEWGFKNHITLKELLHLIEIGINSETKEIDFDLFKQYDFNRD